MKQKFIRFIYQILAFFTRIYLKRIKPQIIWITWSVGKTSCRIIVSQTLQNFLKNKKIYTSPKNYNSEIWLICSIFQVEDYNPSFLYILWLFFKIFFKSLFSSKNYDILVLEYWVDKPKDMDFLLSVARPDISIFTKLDFIHVENFSSQEELWLEKSKLIFAARKSAYLNKDDNFALSIYSEIDTEKYLYNESIPEYNYVFDSWKILSNVNVDWKIFRTNLVWEENMVYFELALQILVNFWFDFSQNYYEINFELQKWRFSIFEGIFESVIIDSSYNAGPESMKSMIKNSISLRKELFPSYKNLFVLWDMREIWIESEKKHKEIFELASRYWEIFSVWKETWAYFWKHIWNFKYANQAWKILRSYLEEHKDEEFVILFKWSQNTIFLEEAIKEVLKNKEDEKELVRQESYWKKTDF